MDSCPNCSAKIPDQSNFCPDCGQPLSTEFEPTLTYRPEGEQESSDDDVRSSPLTFPDSSHHGQFLPGTRLAGRYRIVSRLGRGGMGEVYRADDLKLGHPVALKFLRKEVADDRQRLELLYNEVRLARQVSHPNVCRVYDIAEEEGRHFLSMEYIDGEDLKVLLLRIGRLPKDKGVQIAQQLCAGLAAAHEKGVLHRDLKPANVMIDGRGQVRITDFGLAKLVNSGAEAEIAGTPAYMAPEQITRGQTTIQSDLYSLGLILYELFTGKAVHKSASMAELIRTHEVSSPSKPSSLVEDMDPVVERVIVRCLEKEPQERPKTARAVAAALPGGDPLAAALAAGETPSPEMVAAAGETSGLSLKVGVIHLSVICMLLVALPLLASWLDKQELSHLRENEPAVLKNNAVQWVKRLGYTTASKDSVFGFADARDFRYRQSTRPLRPRITRLFGGGITRKITHDNPSVLEPGMISVGLDPSKTFDSGEQLVEFLAVPESNDFGKEMEAITNGTNWEPYFQAVKVDQAGFRPVTGAERPKNWRPPIYADDVSVWRARDSEETHLIMAVRNSRLVYFRRARKADEGSGFAMTSETTEGTGFFTVLATVLAGLLALRNLKLGRTDARGGLHFAVYYFAVECILGVFTIHHVADFGSESLLVANYLIYALARTLRVWLYYVGFEPYVRRLWPNVLITWSRVLSRRFRDPLVGRDLLVGCIFGIVLALAVQLNDGRPAVGSLDTNLGGSSVLVTVLRSHQLGLIVALYYMAVLLLCRVLLRRTAFAVGLFTIAMTLNTTLSFGFSYEVWDVWIVNAITAFGVAILFVRFGLVSVMAGLVCFWLLVLVPHTTDFGAWYAVSGNFALATVLLLACFGFYTSTRAGRSSFSTLDADAT